MSGGDFKDIFVIALRNTCRNSFELGEILYFLDPSDIAVDWYDLSLMDN